MKSVKERRFFHEFAFNNKALLTFVEFEFVENVQSSNVVEFKFKLRHIPNEKCPKSHMLQQQIFHSTYL